jgi:hypothetical protein
MQEIEQYEKDIFLRGKTEKETVIVDGVINAEKFFDSKIKIGWFLKEAYTTEESFHMRKYYGGEKAYEDFFKNTAVPTWHPVIYSSFGILNGFKKWDDIPYVRDKNELVDVIQQIAIINANKNASITGTYTESGNLEAGFNKWKDITTRQIDILKPNVFVFASTFYLYKDLLEIKDHNLIESDYKGCNIFEKDQNLYIDTYHPAQTQMSQVIYVDQIIEAVQLWFNRKK